MMRNTLAAILLVSAASAVWGCTPRAEMRQYQAPKLRQIGADVRADSTEEFLGQWNKVSPDDKDRMLAAIILKGELGWFFKVTGPNAAVAEQTEPFLALLKSIRFSGEPLRPQWQLPEGWKESGGSGMRYATITLGPDDARLELTVIPLPTPDLPVDAYLLSNVNRWRGQLGLAPLDLDELHEQTGRIALEKESATLVNIAGTLKESSSSAAPFAGGLPEGHPTIPGGDLAVATTDGGAPGTSASASDSAGGTSGGSSSSASSSAGESGAIAVADPPPGMSYKVPEGWKSAANDALSAVAFEVGEGDAKVRITITPAGGDLLANINRWRRQVQLAPVTADELREQVEELKIEGAKGVYVSLVGPADAKPRNAILGAIVGGGERTWFFKLMGPADPAAKEEANFKALLDSLKFAADKN